VYIFGEVVNSSTQPYDVNDIDLTFFGPTGAILALTEPLDMPGDFFVPPNGAMPFQISADLESPGFTHYNNLIILAEPGDHSPRDDLPIQITGTTPEEGDLLVEVRWTNPSPVSAYVSPFVVAYDAQGRVSNLAIGFLTADTFASVHTLEMTLFANSCWSADDRLVPGIVGE
jgi:hypothetical protein